MTSTAPDGFERTCCCNGHSQWLSLSARSRAEAERLADEIERFGYTLYIFDKGARAVEYIDGSGRKTGEFGASGFIDLYYDDAPPALGPAKTREEFDERRREIARRAGVSALYL